MTPKNLSKTFYIFFETFGSTRYCRLYPAKRREHQLSPSYIVVWSCDLVALLWKLLYQRLIDFAHLVPIENNLQSGGVTTSYLYCCFRLSKLNKDSSREKRYLTVILTYCCTELWFGCSFVKTALSFFGLTVRCLDIGSWSVITYHF